MQKSIRDFTDGVETILLGEGENKDVAQIIETKENILDALLAFVLKVRYTLTSRAVTDDSLTTAVNVSMALLTPNLAGVVF